MGGIVGISLSETKDYVSKYDTGEPKVIWKLGVLDSDVFTSLGKYVDNPLRMLYEVVRFGLKGFENFKDSQGNNLNFNTVGYALGSESYRVITNALLKIVPSQIVSELGGEIIKMSELDGDERKN